MSVSNIKFCLTHPVISWDDLATRQFLQGELVYCRDTNQLMICVDGQLRQLTVVPRDDGSLISEWLPVETDFDVSCFESLEELL